MNDNDFKKLTKSQKLSLKEIDFDVEGIQTVLFIPTKRKSGGYTLCAFFVKDINGNWFRLMDYDCFRFINAHNYFKGDFENGGIQFFLGIENRWRSSYGGEFQRLTPH